MRRFHFSALCERRRATLMALPPRGGNFFSRLRRAGPLRSPLLIRPFRSVSGPAVLAVLSPGCRYWLPVTTHYFVDIPAFLTCFISVASRVLVISSFLFSEQDSAETHAHCEKTLFLCLSIGFRPMLGLAFRWNSGIYGTSLALREMGNVLAARRLKLHVSQGQPSVRRFRDLGRRARFPFCSNARRNRVSLTEAGSARS